MSRRPAAGISPQNPDCLLYMCGRMLPKWYNMIWMEKIIGKHGNPCLNQS